MRINIASFVVYCLVTSTEEIKVKFLDIPFESFAPYVPEGHIVA